MNWYEPIQLTAPTVRDIGMGRAWRFVFSAKTHLRATAAPPTGTDVSSIYPFSSLGCVGITGFGARVKSSQVIPFRGDLAMLVEIIEPQGFSANDSGPELRGSRSESNDDIWRYGVMKFISTDGTTDVPVAGTDYFTPAPYGSTIESGLTGRRCKKIDQDWDTIPGLCISTVTFIGATPYAAETDGPEIKGSRKDGRDKDGNKTGEMLFLSTDRTTDVPIPGTTPFTNMDGVTEDITSGGRICHSLAQDDTTIPGLIFTRAMFVAVRSGGYVSGATPAANATLDKYFVSRPEDVHAAYYASKQWILMFEIPIAIYTTAWVAAKLPNVGDGPGDLSTLVEPNVEGALLHRRVGYYVKPDFVGITLAYGWRSGYFDSLTRVSVRPVTIRRRLVVDTNSDPLDGPAGPDTRYAVSGDQNATETDYQITVVSILTDAEMTDVAAAFNNQENNCNDNSVTFNKVIYATGTVKFVGMGSETILASQSPTGSESYRATLAFHARSSAWRKSVNRYIETRTIQRVVVKSAALAVGHGRIGAWVRASSGTSKDIRDDFDMGTALGLLP